MFCSDFALELTAGTGKLEESVGGETVFTGSEFGFWAGLVGKGSEHSGCGTGDMVLGMVAHGSFDILVGLLATPAAMFLGSSSVSRVPMSLRSEQLSRGKTRHGSWKAA